MKRYSIGSTGTFVKGGDGNVAETSEHCGVVHMTAEDIERLEIEAEVEASLGPGNCHDCDDYEESGRECPYCTEQRWAMREPELEPIEFAVTVKRSLPRDCSGNLILESLPLFR